MIRHGRAATRKIRITSRRGARRRVGSPCRPTSDHQATFVVRTAEPQGPDRDIMDGLCPRRDYPIGPHVADVTRRTPGRGAESRPSYISRRPDGSRNRNERLSKTPDICAEAERAVGVRHAVDYEFGGYLRDLVGAVGCGESPGTRAVSGGLLGAGAGAAVGGATGGSAGTGALVGAGVGAAGGALTAPRRY